MQAYTNPVSDRVMGYLSQTSKVLGEEGIMQEPEHILVARCKDIRINHSE
jgi:hypothetical protein